MPPTDAPRTRAVLQPTRAVLEAEISRLADQIDARSYVVVGLDAHVDSGCPYIEIGTSGRLHWIVKERGQMLEHRTTSDPDEVPANP